MTQLSGNIDDFGMCTATLAGPLEARLRAVREAGFSQVMLDARDIVDHPQGLEAAVAALRLFIFAVRERAHSPGDG